MTKSLLAAMFLCTALTASASAEEFYDPNFVPYDAKAVVLPQCGFSIGLDQTWKFESKEKQKDANTEYFYHFGSDSKLNPRPFDVFVFNPQIRGFVNCRASIDKNGQQRTGERLKTHVKSFVERLHGKGSAKGSYVNFSEIEEAQIAGLDVAYVYSAEVPPEEGTEFSSRGVAFWLAATKGDLFVTGWVQLIDPVGGEERVAKGETAKGKSKSGMVSVKLENDATLVENVYYGSRSLEQDREYVMNVLRSIQ